METRAHHILIGLFTLLGFATLSLVRFGGLRPGALEHVGLGEQRRRELNPGLVDVSLSAYGWSDLVESSCTTCDFFPEYYDEPEEEGGNPIPQSIRYRWPDATR